MEWPQWRGPGRDGRVPWLPASLPEHLSVLWRQDIPGAGIGGIAAAQGHVVLGCRDTTDTLDVFLAVSMETGEPVWQVSYPAPGQLDYGNSPRATPLIHDGLVYLQGAMGHLTCADLATGAILWQRPLASDFGTPPLEWGLAGSPLLIDERLYVMPGGSRGSLVCLDPYSGETVWSSGSAPPAHASLMYINLPSGPQLIGYDKLSLGGWRPDTGERLWTVTPPLGGDFNVPTPIPVENGLFLSTENNGSRLHRFDSTGRLASAPVAVYEDLCPDASTPVMTAGRVFGLSAGLHCLDLDGLKSVWTEDGREFYEYGALLASHNRVLCLTLRGELILIDALANRYRELGRLTLKEDAGDVLSHPALVGRRLFVRIGNELLCVNLQDE